MSSRLLKSKYISNYTFRVEEVRGREMQWRRNREIEKERGGTYVLRYEIALFTFFIPTFAVLCKIWRCRFDVSTSSPSTIPIVPTPAPARYAAAGHPRPPAPTMRTDASLRRSWPGYMTYLSHCPLSPNKRKIMKYT